VRPRLRRVALRIARAAVDLLDDSKRMAPTEHDWLLEDVREDLAAMIDLGRT
jgi:hypothetical protein